MRVNVITSGDIARCPKHSLMPRHYRDDGTCYCNEADERRGKAKELRRLRRQLLIEIKELEEVL